MAHIGIDLGTSNTLVARVTEDGRPEILEVDGVTSVPSFIAIEEEGGLVHIGEVACDMWANPHHDPETTFRRWKLRMGENIVLRELSPGGARGNTLPVTPEYLTAQLVERLVAKISEGLGATTVDSVLATVPHGWRRLTPEKCRATREAVARARHNGRPLRVQEYTLSEPVAAAVYYLWEHERVAGPAARAALTGQHLLVCDVGGGTFDVSLIRLGEPGAPLDVIFGANTENAGDYVDALLCAWIGRHFEASGFADHPASAKEVLDDIASRAPRWPFLREWFGKVRDIKHKLSIAARAAADAGRSTQNLKAQGESFTGLNDQHLRISIGPSELDEAISPFYQQGRELIRQFLKQSSGVRPWAAVFCGGGSRVVGLREHVIQPVLTEAFGAPAAREILDRIKLPQRVDHAIALGAALVANGMVQIQEHIQHDVGLIFDISDPSLARELGLAPGERTVLLTPILAKGAPLPHQASNDATNFQGIDFYVPPGQSVVVQLVVEDDPADPWLQPFEIPSPTQGKRQSLTWSVGADRDGVITIRLQTAGGVQTEVEAQLERRHRLGGSSNPEIHGPKRAGHWRRVPPEKVRAALDKLDRLAREVAP